MKGTRNSAQACKGTPVEKLVSGKGARSCIDHRVVIGRERGIRERPYHLAPDFQIELIFRLSRRFVAPRRGVASPPGPELLGAITSHGPSRESYKLFRKARRPPAKEASAAATDTALSAERMRTTLSTPTRAAAVLQRWLPGGGAGMVGVEGPADLPKHGGGQAEAERAKPTLPEAHPGPKAVREKGHSGNGEGHH